MTHIEQRVDTAANLASSNPVLNKGEMAWESGATPKAKLGDGVTAYNALPYAVLPAATLASPVFTGDPKAPTPATADNDTSIATTAFVKAQGYAPIASPIFTGDPTAPTPATGDNDTSVATTAFVKAQAYATLASPTFTGDPKVPTPSPGDNDTSIASTAFVKAAIDAFMLAMNPIGTIKMTTVNTNPGTYIAGTTWAAWGTGRVPVGVDTGQTEFDTVEETGGEKTHILTVPEMPAHEHVLSTFLTDTGTGASAPQRVDVAPADKTANTGAGQGSTVGGGGAHNNLQPYITCYMWKRTV